MLSARICVSPLSCFEEWFFRCMRSKGCTFLVHHLYSCRQTAWSVLCWLETEGAQTLIGRNCVYRTVCRIFHRFGFSIDWLIKDPARYKTTPDSINALQTSTRQLQGDVTTLVSHQGKLKLCHCKHRLCVSYLSVSIWASLATGDCAIVDQWTKAFIKLALFLFLFFFRQVACSRWVRFFFFFSKTGVGSWEFFVCQAINVRIGDSKTMLGCVRQEEICVIRVCEAKIHLNHLFLRCGHAFSDWLKTAFYRSLPGSVQKLTTSTKLLDANMTLVVRQISEIWKGNKCFFSCLGCLVSKKSNEGSSCLGVFSLSPPVCLSGCLSLCLNVCLSVCIKVVRNVLHHEQRRLRVATGGGGGGEIFKLFFLCILPRLTVLF